MQTRLESNVKVEPVVDVGKGGYDEKPFRHSSPRNLTDVFPGRTQNGSLFEVFESGGPFWRVFDHLLGYC